MIQSNASFVLFKSCKAIDLFNKAWILFGSNSNTLLYSLIPSSFLDKRHNDVPFAINELIWFAFKDNSISNDSKDISNLDNNWFVRP